MVCFYQDFLKAVSQTHSQTHLALCFCKSPPHQPPLIITQKLASSLTPLCMSLAQLTLDNLESSLPLPGPSHLILSMEAYIADCNANFHHWSPATQCLASSIVMPLFSSFLSISFHYWSSYNLTWTSPIYTKAFSHRLLSINESNLFGLPFQGRHFSMWPQIFHILCNIPLRQIRLIAIS